MVDSCVLSLFLYFKALENKKLYKKYIDIVRSNAYNVR